MKIASVAEAKEQLSALLTQVEAGEEVVITRRGKPVARMIQEPAAGLDWAALRAWVADEKPAAGPTVEEMRERDLL